MHLLENFYTRNVFSFLYKCLVKPILFQIDASKVHQSVSDLGERFGQFRLTRSILGSFLRYRHPSLEKTLCGIHFENPIGLAAGFDYEAKLPGVLPAVGFGFATVGTVTLHPYKGNEGVQLDRFPRSQALLVNKGFKSLGAKAIIRKLEGRVFEIPVGISIGSTNKIFHTIEEQIADIINTFQLFEQSEVKHSYYELNISCPNTVTGQPFLQLHYLWSLLSELEKLALAKPVFVKMPIDLSQTETLALLTTIDASFISGVIFGNLTKDKHNPDVHRDDRALWQSRKGNLSGKPTWERSNRWIRLTRQHFGKRFVIIGTGGVFSGRDAATKFEAGADLVQLITGMVYEGPQLVGEINRYLAHGVYL